MNVRTALVTGAGRGIGAQVARVLAPTHDLILAGRHAGRLEAVADAVGGARILTVDLTDESALAEATAAVAELDALVHCAGIASSLRPVAATAVDEWRRLMDVNVIAAAELTRLVLPALRARNGHVVFLNSGAGQNVRAGWTPYAASKFALRALADGLRAEEPDLRVTSIYPGRVDTDMQRDIVAIEGREYDASKFLTPETVALAVAQAIAAPADAHPTDLTLRPRG